MKNSLNRIGFLVEKLRLEAETIVFESLQEYSNKHLVEIRTTTMLDGDCIVKFSKEPIEGWQYNSIFEMYEGHFDLPKRLQNKINKYQKIFNGYIRPVTITPRAS